MICDNIRPNYVNKTLCFHEQGFSAISSRKGSRQQIYSLIDYIAVMRKSLTYTTMVLFLDVFKSHTLPAYPSYEKHSVGSTLDLMSFSLYLGHKTTTNQLRAEINPLDNKE